MTRLGLALALALATPACTVHNYAAPPTYGPGPASYVYAGAPTYPAMSGNAGAPVVYTPVAQAAPMPHRGYYPDFRSGAPGRGAHHGVATPPGRRAHGNPQLPPQAHGNPGGPSPIAQPGPPPRGPNGNGPAAAPAPRGPAVHAVTPGSPGPRKPHRGKPAHRRAANPNPPNRP
jgi:hypothetical protein